jgi:serine/threonine protein kinase
MPGSEDGVEGARACASCAGLIVEDGPEGLCPACLLREGLPTAGPPEDVETQALPVRRVDLSAPPPASLSREVEGRYTRLIEAARGGMGRVWLARDSQLGREVALKEMLHETGETLTPSDPPPHPAGGRFAREARITAQLQHPAITPVYELGQRLDGTLYYTMKFVRGKTLSRAITEARSFEERRRLLPHFVDLCQAIAYAHSRGVVHRDIKPANVMVGDFGETVVVDWGLAKVANEETPSPPGESAGPWTGTGDRTMAGHAVGTPAYMPPEQALGRLDEVDEKSDVYSLGAVLYEILTGRQPYAGDTAAAVIAKVVREPAPPARAVDPAVPEEYARICARAMARDRSARCGSARELAAEIETVRLRPRRTAARRSAEILAGVLVLGLPIAVTLANRRSENALHSAMERLATKGVDVTAGDPATVPRSHGDDLSAESDTRTTLSPVGELYALRWRFPGLADEDGPLWRTLRSLEKGRGTPLAAWPAEQQGQARSLVAANQTLLDALDTMAQLPPEEGSLAFRHALVSAGNPFSADLPDFVALRGAGLVLAYRARIAAAEGRFGEALDDLAQIVRISNHHAFLPWLISSLRRFILVEDALDVVEASAAEWRATGDAPSSFESALSSLDPRRELPRALEGEIRSMIWGFDAVRRGHGGGLPGAGHWMSRLGWSVYGSAPLRFWPNGDQSLYVGFMADYLEAMRRPYPEARSDLERIDREATRSRGWRHPIMDTALVSASSLAERGARVESRALRARLRLALARLRDRHGSLPATLEAVTREARMEAAVDPLSGLPFVYRPGGGTFELEPPGTGHE